MDSIEEGTEVVKKKDKKNKEKSKKGKKDEVSGNGIYDAKQRGKDVVTEGAKSAERENGSSGDDERKRKKKNKNKNKMKKTEEETVENNGRIEESNNAYGGRSGNGIQTEPRIHGEKNHDGNGIEKVERKKKKKKRENDKSRASDDLLQEQNFENVKGRRTSGEVPNELQNGIDVEAVEQGLVGVAIIMKKKSRKPEDDLNLGSVEKGRTYLTKHETHDYNKRVEAFAEGCDLESKRGKSKKRKREKDWNIVSEVELGGHDSDDPVSRSQSIVDGSDPNELEKGEDVAAITQASEGDVVEKDEIKEKKKRKKTKDNSGSGGDTTTNIELGSHFNNGTEDEKEKTKSVDSESKNPKPKKGKKKVNFSGKDEVFPLPEDNFVRGKRFSKEEDEMVKAAVFRYIEASGLGDEGLKMVLNCKLHPNVLHCWKEIRSALPHRPQSAIYYRAHVLFGSGDKRKWTEEEFEIIREFQKKHGNQWKMLAEELGKHRIHVKDAWRRIRPANLKKGSWSQEEYQALFDLVNLDMRMKYSEEKKSKYGMLRDNVPWTAISEKMTTRSDPACCYKWYHQLASHMVMEGDWADSDDYRLIGALFELDATCYEDVDWDNLLDHRPGTVCRKRWNEMLLHIGGNVKRSFADQVEVLAKRYCPELLELRETWDNKPHIPWWH